MKCVFSVDVEDWYHILDLPTTPPISQWDGLPSCIEKNFRKLLGIFGEKEARATCFFLGWVAQRFPQLVREADEQGHEIASHGYAHKLIYEMTRKEFLEDATRSRKVLEDITGRRVLGYRSPGFSVIGRISWFFDVLLEAGYGYDSSVFPASRGHGGMKTDRYAPYRVGRASPGLVEFPITVTRFLGRPICCFGGGYLRLYPLSVIRRMTRRVLAEGRPVVFYIHPREIDPSHPRLPMGLCRRFKSYLNLETTEPKIRSLLAEFEVTTFRDYLDFIPPNPPVSAELSPVASGSSRGDLG